MRRRLLVSTVAVLAAALVAFTVPLGVAVRGILTDRALDGLQGEVEQLALVIDEQARNCDELQLLLALGDRAGTADLTLVAADGRVVAFGGAEAPRLGDEIRQAARSGRVGRRAGDDRLAVAAPLRTDRCGVSLLLHASVDDDGLRGSIRGAWLGLGVIGLLVLTAAGGGALLLGRHLARPFEELAASARRLGDGDFTARAPRSGLPEGDAIAAALDGTADRLGRALGRGTAFAADASHQLRTPLTALRLQLESLAATGADRAAVAAALAEADRLEATIDELVALTQMETTEVDLDLVGLVHDRARGWQELAARDGRRLVVHTDPVPPVKVRPAAVGQALQVLLDNALAHGQGTIRVEITAASRGAVPAGVQVCVIDEGPGFDATASMGAGADRGARTATGGDGDVGAPPVRGGRGLGLARSLIEAEGGRLTLSSAAAGTRACLHLPSVRT